MRVPLARGTRLDPQSIEVRVSGRLLDPAHCHVNPMTGIVGLDLPDEEWGTEQWVTIEAADNQGSRVLVQAPFDTADAPRRAQDEVLVRLNGTADELDALASFGFTGAVCPGGGNGQLAGLVRAAHARGLALLVPSGEGADGALESISNRDAGASCVSSIEAVLLRSAVGLDGLATTLEADCWAGAGGPPLLLDVPSPASGPEEDAQRLRTTLLLSLAGTPVFEKPVAGGSSKVAREWIEARKDSVALRRGALRVLAAEPERLVFARTAPGEVVVVSLARHPAGDSVTVPLPEEWGVPASFEVLALNGVGPRDAHLRGRSLVIRDAAQTSGAWRLRW
ncbi:hypothetical protein HZA57_04390 [Candidatus Poribacteria bacterium]|nr:hypothetical protein [Candidatus Poribacteria bacterium]